MLSLIFDIFVCCLVTVIKHDFLVYEVFKIVFTKREFLKIEVVGADFLSYRLIVWEMKLFEIWMRQGFVDGDTVFRIIC